MVRARLPWRATSNEAASAGARSPEGAMMMKAGLLAACIGALLLAVSSHLGGVTGFVGTVVWKTHTWRLVNVVGWLLLIGGFLLQYLHVRRAP